MGLLSFRRKHCCEDNGDLSLEKAFGMPTDCSPHWQAFYILRLVAISSSLPHSFSYLVPPGSPPRPSNSHSKRISVLYCIVTISRLIICGITATQVLSQTYSNWVISL